MIIKNKILSDVHVSFLFIYFCKNLLNFSKFCKNLTLSYIKAFN